MATSIKALIACFITRFVPGLAFLLARPLAGVTFTSRQIDTLNEYGIDRILIGYQRKLGRVIQRVFWDERRADNFLPPNDAPLFPCDALVIRRTGERSFELRGGAAYQQCTPQQIQALFEPILTSGTENIRFIRSMTVRRSQTTPYGESRWKMNYPTW